MSDNINDKPGSEDQLDPAAAFEALRQTVEEKSQHLNAEMMVIRKGLEAAFEQFDNVNQPIDYKDDIAKLNKGYGVVAEYLHSISAMSILKYEPEHLTRKFEAAGEEHVRMSVEEFRRQGQDLERMSKNMARQLDDLSSRRSGKIQFWFGASIGLLVSILVLIVLLRVLPIGNVIGFITWVG